MQVHAADECRTNALHCVDIAKYAHTANERAEFFAFAEAWYKLADEINHSERLISFIDALVGGEPVKDNAERAALEFGVQSLTRLTAAIVAIPNRLIANRSYTAKER